MGHVVNLVDWDNWGMLAFVSSVALLFVYYLIFVVQKPRIHCGNKNLEKFILRHMPSISENFWPSWYCWEGRLQSGFGLICRISSRLKLPYRRHILSLKDGGQLALDFMGEKDKVDDEERLLVLVMPGMTSMSQTSYIKTLALSIVRSGATVVVMNNRGLGGIELTTPRTYCVTFHDDVREVVSYLKEAHPDVKLMAIGTSVGGMIFTRYVINHPLEARESFVAAMVISICWDPMDGTASIETPFVNKYFVNGSLTQNLQRLVRTHRKVLATHSDLDIDRILSAKTLREFDDLFVAPQFGYPSWYEYYKDATITSRIKEISIPMVAVNACDDPIQPGSGLPVLEAEAEDSKLAFVVTSHGGHLGFMDSIFPLRKTVHYMEKIVSDYVNAVRLHSDELLKV